MTIRNTFWRALLFSISVLPHVSHAACAPDSHAPKLLPAGYMQTKGSQIVDAKGIPVRITAIGWNQPDAPPYKTIDQNIAAMKDAGFNAIRFSWVNGTRDKNLADIDQVAASARKYGLKLVLDNHSNEPGHGEQDGWGAQQKNGLWYDKGGASDGTDGGGNKGGTTDESFLADWVAVARHFKGNDTILGYDLRNEPLAEGHTHPGSHWGDGSNQDLRAMYIRVGNAIQAVDSGPLIICESMIDYPTKAYEGDLRVIRQYPVTLSIANKVVYSPHQYPTDISGIGEENDRGPAYVARMNTLWGWMVKENVAPIWIGEMGSAMETPAQLAWAGTLLAYMNGKLGAAGGPTFSGNEQPIGGDWWAWGYLPGQMPNGYLQQDGTPKPNQADAVKMMLPLSCVD